MREGGVEKEWVTGSRRVGRSVWWSSEGKREDGWIRRIRKCNVDGKGWEKTGGFYLCSHPFFRSQDFDNGGLVQCLSATEALERFVCNSRVRCDLEQNSGVLTCGYESYYWIISNLSLIMSTTVPHRAPFLKGSHSSSFIHSSVRQTGRSSSDEQIEVCLPDY